MRLVANFEAVLKDLKFRAERGGEQDVNTLDFKYLQSVARLGPEPHGY